MAASENKNKNREQASRLAYLRSDVFRTIGYPSNGPMPSPSQARKDWAANLRAMAAQRPMPSVRQ